LSRQYIQRKIVPVPEKKKKKKTKTSGSTQCGSESGSESVLHSTVCVVMNII